MKVPKTEHKTDVELFAISKTRLVVLTILTLGLYEVYWFYRNWKALMPAMPNVKHPVWRAIFSIFYCYSLFKLIINNAKAHGFKKAYSPGWLAIFYIIFLLSGNAPASTDEDVNNIQIGVSILTLVPLLFVHDALQFVEGKRRETEYGTGEIILIVFGGLLFALMFLGVLY